MSTRRRFPRSPRARLLLTLGLLLLAGFLTSKLTLRAVDEGVPAAGPAGAESPARTASGAGKDRKRQSNKAKAVQNSASATAASTTANQVATLEQRLNHQEELLAAQQQQIAKLVTMVEEQKKLLERNTPPSDEAAQALNLGQAVSLGEVASLAPVLPVVAAGGTAEGQALTTPATPSSTQSPPQEPQAYTPRIMQLEKTVEGISKGIAGFRFSGDLRIRSDNLWRSGNSVAGPLQNLRGTYRLRFNIDKNITDQVNVHLQLGSGRFNNPVTDDTEFGGSNVRGPIFLSEAWVNWHPNTHVNLQAGKMPEVFQDYTRFMWDEDMRFNGGQESFGLSPKDNALGVTRIDFMAGQYVLTNPNVQVLPSAKACTPPPPQVITTLPATITQPAPLPANCAYLAAGYQPGENVRDSNLFDQGVFFKGKTNGNWSHYMFTDFLLYRNANQIAFGSTPAGSLLLTNNVLGVTVSSPLPGTGNATTVPGGAVYTAGHFQIGRLAYRITYDGWQLHGESFPVFIDVQGSRNFGAGFLRNAWMATLNAGEVRKRGDIRFLYAYGAKDANSMISQYTDDHFGSNTGVNIRTNMIRFDLGLAKFLQWQNILYIQKEISGNDPARHFYVPIPAGAATQYRAETQLFVNF
ncbi:MAG TPA: putative porin [Terriglobia bacterium]|nr:putative porin [Terriglobia bacterium]